MLKMFFWLLLLSLCALQAQAGENLAEVKTSSYISLGKPMVLNLSGGKRLTFLQISADVLVVRAPHAPALPAGARVDVIDLD